MDNQQVGFVNDVPGIGIYPDGMLISFRTKNPKILAPYYQPNGYIAYVDEYKDKKRKIYYVHRLVAKAFIPNPYNLPEVNHIDGNKHNNNIDNLEWCTKSYNQQMSEQKGKVYSLDKPRGKTLSKEKSLEVRNYIKANLHLSQRQLAFNLGVSRTTIIYHLKKLTSETIKPVSD